MTNDNIIFADDYVKKRILDMKLVNFRDDYNNDVKEFYNNNKTGTIIPHSFLKAKSIGIVSKYDSNLYREDYYFFINFNITTLFFSSLLYRRYLSENQSIAAMNKTGIRLMAFT